MSLTLNVDGARWRDHLDKTVADLPHIVPVAKGNGYGFGLPRLAVETTRLGCDTLGVGTYDELARVLTRFHGDLLVLSPWRPFGTALELDPNPRVIHTVSRLQDLPALLEDDPDARFVLERSTSMQRHGLSAKELRDAAGLLTGGTLEGVAVHLPLDAGGNLIEARRLMTDVVAAGLPTTTVWISHLAPADQDRLAARYPEYTFRPRIGTDLWLGDRDALRVTATVLDVHPVERGDVYGYRARSAPRSGTILVVSGGTAHGIGLESPSGDLSLRSRAASLARGGLDAAGFVRSPYSVFGRQRLFAEPPHMQASMLFLPQGALLPQIGDEVDVRVRYTTTAFDRVLIG